MTPLSRSAIRIFGFLFAINYLVLGLPWYSSYNTPELAWISFALHGVLVSLLVFYPSNRELPTWLAGLCVAGAISQVALANSYLDPATIPANGSFATWYVGGASATFALVAGRGHRVLGILGLALEVILVLIWGGFAMAITSGVVGAIMLVLAVAALVKGIESANKSAAGSQSRQRDLETSLATSSAAKLQRDYLLQRVLDLSFPTLDAILRSGGRLSEEARAEARQQELALRDELNNRDLLSAELRVAIRQARDRGVRVSFRDEHGLPGLDAQTLSDLQHRVASAVNSARSGTVTIRTHRDENYLVKVVAQRPDEERPDLWLTLP